MHTNLVKNISSSFLSCEKDTEEILKKLFITFQPHSNELKKLLVVHTKDCLNNDTSQVIKDAVDKATIPYLIKEGHVKLSPKLAMEEFEEIKSTILLSYDTFTPNASNPYFRDCTIMIDIICHTDYWDLENYSIRPLKIAGYVDGILNNTRLSGLGTLQFLGCNQLILSENLSGYTLSYRAVHGNDDRIPSKD